MRYISDLQSLDIAHNLLVSLSGQSDFAMNDVGQAVSPFFRLEQLNMSYNRLCKIDLLPITLTELDIANNFIEKLPKNFTTLTNLQVLNISRNKLVNSNGTEVDDFVGFAVLSDTIMLQATEPFLKSCFSLPL